MPIVTLAEPTTPTPFTRIDLEAVLVAQTWFEDQQRVVLWDGTRCIFASATIPKTMAIIREAVVDGGGWISVKDAWVKESSPSDVLELDLDVAIVRWIAPHNAAVKARKEWARQTGLVVPVASVLETGQKWRCSRCFFFTALGQSHCYLCGKVYCVGKDRMV
jgi:hypothetical protein